MADGCGTESQATVGDVEMVGRPGGGSPSRGGSEGREVGSRGIT